MLKEHFDKYISELMLSLRTIPFDKVELIVQILLDVHKTGKHVYVMGNGGSAATASHFVCDLAKGTKIEGKKPFKVTSLNDNIPLLTAWSNDLSYETVFKSQLEDILEEGDLVIAFTGSGNSPNILRALEYSMSVGAKTIAFTGFNGGKVKELADVCLIVNSDNMERIEDIHLVLEHLIKLYLKKN